MARVKSYRWYVCAVQDGERSFIATVHALSASTASWHLRRQYPGCRVLSVQEHPSLFEAVEKTCHGLVAGF